MLKQADLPELAAGPGRRGCRRRWRRLASSSWSLNRFAGNLSVGTGDKWLDDQPALKGSPMGTRTQVCMEGREQSHGGVAALVVLDLEPRPRITER
jgi:hypothetical protein